MAMIRGPARAICIGSALLLLTACDKLAGDDTEFARAALERNEQLSIVKFDKDARTFTVKVRDTGEIQVVRADEIIATLPAAEAPAVAKPAAASAEEPASARDAPVAASGEPARPAPGSELPPAPEQANIASGGVARGTGFITNSSGKVFETGGTGAADAVAEDGNAATTEPRNRRTLASGPGYSINKSADAAPPPAIRLASSSGDIPSPARGVALERRYEPMICQGQRLLHIDGRNLEFEGDAITAEAGCEIHITNSHIIAHGIGVSARAANVHIKNSVVEGDSGSVSASDGAQVYTQSSTFKGLSRRLDTASFHDLGGTVWN